YLTFDDGPTPKVTEELLDILKELNVKATFFCIARNVERYPEIYQRILDEGHSVGNHTYSHLKGWQSEDRDYMNDINLAENFIDSKIFRPPYGRIKRSQIKLLKKKYKIIMWDVMSRDYHPNTTAEDCYSIVMKQSRAGSIIVFHDSVKCAEKMLPIIPRIIKEFTTLGFSFEKING
ncbi:MAG: polysaccharide deacetylase family protein, partial [Bacteroidales bacterium]|nr:polysaccharide deacetylase family protein [Bacteroidales bacterium]